METLADAIIACGLPPLGNFLSGMETEAVRGGEAALPALETSLVEWKQVLSFVVSTFYYVLGNFLSGMETSFANRFFLWCPPLETSLVEWKRSFQSGQDQYRINLGNFLSGMETKGGQKTGQAISAPWKLP